jgi:hypothetical protein
MKPASYSSWISFKLCGAIKYPWQLRKRRGYVGRKKKRAQYEAALRHVPLFRVMAKTIDKFQNFACVSPGYRTRCPVIQGVFVCLDDSQGQALEMQLRLFVCLDFVGACATQNPKHPWPRLGGKLSFLLGTARSGTNAGAGEWWVWPSSLAQANKHPCWLGPTVQVHQTTRSCTHLACLRISRLYLSV